MWWGVVGVVLHAAAGDDEKPWTTEPIAAAARTTLKSDFTESPDMRGLLCKRRDGARVTTRMARIKVPQGDPALAAATVEADAYGESSPSDTPSARFAIGSSASREPTKWNVRCVCTSDSFGASAAAGELVSSS